MIDDTRLLSKPIAAGAGAVSLLIALMIAVELILKVITLDYYPYAIYFAFISNVVVIPILLLLALRLRPLLLPTLAWVHVSMGTMLIYFSQTYSPFTPAWAILVMVTSMYYGWRGFVSSSSALVATAIGYIVLFPENTEQYGGIINYSILSILVVAVTIFTAYLFANVIMTNRKKNRELTNAQKSELMQVNRLNTLLNSISDAVMTLNRYGRITSQNAAAQAFFDTNQSLVGREIDSLLQLKDDEGQPVSMRSLIDSIKSTILRDDLSTGDEEVRHLSIQMSRIRSTFDDEEEYGVVFIIRDITKQKTLEEEKDEFISVTSHELRTPVAIAEGSLSNLMVMYERHTDEKKLKQAAQAAHEQIIYLSKMINDLSTLSRAERGVGDTVESIDVNDLLHKLFDRYTPEAVKKSLQLNLDVETHLPAVETSRLYLEEILQNFITNAIKYTKEGSVTIGANLTKDGEHIHFFVKDTGIGMSKYDQEHIFDKFYRSEDYRTRETSGTGLGLYVVEKLVMKLGIKIEVESRLNHGSTFSFDLPLEGIAPGLIRADKKIEAPKSPEPAN